MKNSTMLFRAVLVLIILAAIPHAFATWRSETRSEEPLQVRVNQENPLIGKWEATYDEMEGKVIYQIKKKGNKIMGYTVSFVDEAGNAYVDDSLVLEVKHFSKDKGKAMYMMEYEGEKYEVICEFKLEGNSLEISYDYYGYQGKEVWKKINE
ncbi:hypothetical protein QQ008_13730 [Fulvivirgaceae bacterium BMA10]|uniref:DUF4488 domain-containing protein n=1 Tax=Splendidivirga corallicola TaxID=3051826 RepID=A0ABT8KR11_9BACT|nr:hypothetical protein [Fulvivirgaceae bacterium BMA10]